uniref:Uncharacterized protein n=1 Tax=Mandrillus leucophaeus TaxID=9568 RepID=A0A2K5XW01_MANLE
VKRHKNRENSGLYVMDRVGIFREHPASEAAAAPSSGITLPSPTLHWGVSHCASCRRTQLGGEAMGLERRLEKVCGAVCENSGARSLLVEKPKRKSSISLTILSNFGSLVSVSVFPPRRHSFPK